MLVHLLMYTCAYTLFSIVGDTSSIVYKYLNSASFQSYFLAFTTTSTFTFLVFPLLFCSHIHTVFLYIYVCKTYRIPDITIYHLSPKQTGNASQELHCSICWSALFFIQNGFSITHLPKFPAQILLRKKFWVTKVQLCINPKYKRQNNTSLLLIMRYKNKKK